MTRTIGVCPPAERDRRTRLFDALEEALRVRFEGREAPQLRARLAAVISFKDLDPESVTQPCFIAAGSSRIDGPGVVDFRGSPPLDGRLDGRALVDNRAGGLEGLRADGNAVHASCRGRALWTRRGAVQRVALAPDELLPDESLRDLLAPGRWLSLLPLVHFLREVTAGSKWQLPATRAAFVIDDPNLHWRSYGHVRFADLARAAEEGNFHVAFATVPLDAWFVHRPVAQLFGERKRVLSLLIHGNNHTREELARPRPDQRAYALLAQALRRAATLEERSGVAVSRVMVAPHGLCSEQMMRAMLRTGYQGLCHAWGSPRAIDRPLADWEPAEIRAGGLPVFPRLPMTAPRDDLVLRSFLGQPLILYGHHGDLADGVGVLDEAAAFVNREHGVVWGSLTDIARSRYVTRRDGKALRVRVFTREAKLDVPAGVEKVIVELPRTHGEPEREIVTLTTARDSAGSGFPNGVSGPFPIAEPGAVRISLARTDALDPSRVSPPRPRLQPIVRRAAAECRDRLAPIVPKLTRGAPRSRRRSSG